MSTCHEYAQVWGSRPTRNVAEAEMIVLPFWDEPNKDEFNFCQKETGLTCPTSETFLSSQLALLGSSSQTVKQAIARS